MLALALALARARAQWLAMAMVRALALAMVRALALALAMVRARGRAEMQGARPVILAQLSAMEAGRPLQIPLRFRQEGNLARARARAGEQARG